MLLVPAIVVALSALVPPTWRSPVPLCAVNALTGHDCPGCGMTRAFLLVGHGRLAEATAMHPLAIPAFVIVGAMAAVGVFRAIRGR